jgi:hypothetical protein
VLDETFYAALRDHPVPLLEAAIRQLRDRSMSLDIYVWLAWRLHRLTKATNISWPALRAQFGTGFKAIRQHGHQVRPVVGLSDASGQAMRAIGGLRRGVNGPEFRQQQRK